MADDFEKSFKKLCYTRDASTVWTDFLDYSIDQFLINPDKNYFHRDRYEEWEVKEFYNLFHAWIHGMQEKLNDGNKWYDLLGEFYEDIIISSYKAGSKGQFFTPMHVTRLMAEVTYTGYKDKDTDRVRSCYDCACGSGRILLAWHELRPYDVCFGWDLDEQAAKMCVLNFLIHGVRGSVVWCNSISYEFYDAWKVHEFPFSVMSVDSFGESECFIGHSNDCESVVNVHQEAGSMQSTLI